MVHLRIDLAQHPRWTTRLADSSTLVRLLNLTRYTRDAARSSVVGLSFKEPSERGANVKNAPTVFGTILPRGATAPRDTLVHLGTMILTQTTGTANAMTMAVARAIHLHTYPHDVYSSDDDVEEHLRVEVAPLVGDMEAGTEAVMTMTITLIVTTTTVAPTHLNYDAVRIAHLLAAHRICPIFTGLTDGDVT